MWIFNLFWVWLTGKVRVALDKTCPGYELSWVRVVLDTSRLGYELFWVGFVLGTSCPGKESYWARVVLSTSCPGYDLPWVRVVHNPTISLTFTSKLWCVFCEYFGTWQCYNSRTRCRTRTHDINIKERNEKSNTDMHNLWKYRNTCSSYHFFIARCQLPGVNH